MKITELLSEDVASAVATPGAAVTRFQMIKHLSAQQKGLLKQIASGKIEAMDVEDEDTHNALEQLQNYGLLDSQYELTEEGHKVLMAIVKTKIKSFDHADAAARTAAMNKRAPETVDGPEVEPDAADDLDDGEEYSFD